MYFYVYILISIPLNGCTFVNVFTKCMTSARNPLGQALIHNSLRFHVCFIRRVQQTLWNHATSSTRAQDHLQPFSEDMLDYHHESIVGKTVVLHQGHSNRMLVWAVFEAVQKRKQIYKVRLATSFRQTTAWWGGGGGPGRGLGRGQGRWREGGRWPP